MSLMIRFAPTRTECSGSQYQRDEYIVCDLQQGLERYLFDLVWRQVGLGGLYETSLFVDIQFRKEQIRRAQFANSSSRSDISNVVN